MHWSTRAVFFGVLTLFAGCVGDSKNNNIEQCVPGLVAFCACPGGELGTQTCGDNGRYADCACDGAPADAGEGSGDVGSDAGDAGPDASDTDAGDADTDRPDAPPDTRDTTPPDTGSGERAVGQSCTVHGDCASGMCGDFLFGAACTRSCLGACDGAPEGWVCFNRVCTPPDHCDLEASDEGVGPGCADARCGGCPDNSVCAEFGFGRFECVCNPGYRLSDDFRTCENVDECAEETAECSEVSTCVDTDGTYECECNEGYWGPTCAECPGGIDNVCFGRGECDDGTSGAGTCACLPRYGGALCDQECFDVVPAACAMADLAGANLAGRDLSSGDFSDSDMTGLSLANTNFTEADLSRAVARDANGFRTTFDRATLDGADFTSADLDQASFDGATGTAVIFENAGLTDADFANAVLPEANLRGAVFVRVDLNSGSIAGADARSLDWTGGGIGVDADVRNVNFSDADLTGVDLTRAFGTMANFGRTKLISATLREANFSNAAFRNAEANGALVAQANLRGADLFATNFTGANLTGAILADAVCNRTIFVDANLASVNFTNANLTNANLSGATMTGAVVTGVTWSNTTCVDGTNSDANGGTCVGHL